MTLLLPLAVFENWFCNRFAMFVVVSAKGFSTSWCARCMADDMPGMAASMQCGECFCSSAQHSAMIATALAGTAEQVHQAISGVHAENGVSGVVVAAKGS